METMHLSFFKEHRLCHQDGVEVAEAPSARPKELTRAQLRALRQQRALEDSELHRRDREAEEGEVTKVEKEKDDVFEKRFSQAKRELNEDKTVIERGIQNAVGRNYGGLTIDMKKDITDTEGLTMLVTFGMKNEAGKQIQIVAQVNEFGEIMNIWDPAERVEALPVVHRLDEGPLPPTPPMDMGTGEPLPTDVEAIPRGSFKQIEKFMKTLRNG